MKIRLLFLLMSLFFLPACIYRIHVTSNAFANINSIPNGFAAGSTFAVLSITGKTPLLEQDLTLKISRMLEGHGFTVDDPGSVDYILLFSFETTSSEATEYVERYVPGALQTKSGNLYGNYDSLHYQEVKTSPGTVTYLPVQYTLYTQTLHIFVYDANALRENENAEQVWQGSAVTSGKNPDLREISDYLITAIFKNFGKDTKKFVNEMYSLE